MYIRYNCNCTCILLPPLLEIFHYRSCISEQRTKLICSLVTFQVFPAYLYILKICRVGLCTELFCAVIPTLFPLSFFFYSAIPTSHYILRLFSLVYVTFLLLPCASMLKFAISQKVAKICLLRLPHALWASVQPPS